jgi:hypothetical protein
MEAHVKHIWHITGEKTAPPIPADAFGAVIAMISAVVFRDILLPVISKGQ